MRPVPQKARSEAQRIGFMSPDFKEVNPNMISLGVIDMQVRCTI